MLHTGIVRLMSFQEMALQRRQAFEISQNRITEAGMKTDARIRYTKMVIRTAFLDLLSRERIEKITVAQICRSAEINRATFYRYYENQYDLLSSLENEMFDELKKSTKEYKNDIDKLTEIIFVKFSEQRDTWRLLISDYANLSFLTKIFAFFDECFAKDYSTKESELRYRFLLSGYSGIFNHWVKNGMQESPVEMAAYANQFRHDLMPKR